MSVRRDWNAGGDAQVPGWGTPNLRDIVNGLTGQPDATSLTPNERFDGMLVRVPGVADYRWSDASVLAADGVLVLHAADAPATGAWIRDDEVVDVKLAVAFGTADAAVLWTVPTGFTLLVAGSAWEVTTSWTGGTSSAIGLSSSNAGLSTAGDLLGGAAGDLLATLVSTGAKYKGTVGAKVGKPASVLVGGDTVKFNRIASAFTAGAGFAHLFASVLVAPVS